MEKEQFFYKVDRWASKHSEIQKVIATRATEKTIWFMLNNHEKRELLSTSYYQYCKSEDHAKAIIDSHNEAKAKRVAQKRISDAAPALLEALKKAKEFIENGIELGYIRMPDADTPDSAHNTLPMINAAIAAARGEA